VPDGRITAPAPGQVAAAVAERDGVVLLGSGRLFEAVAAALRGVGDAGRPAALVVTVTDGWERDPEVEGHAREAGLPWLPVRTELRRAVVGPLERPGTPGCVDCAEERRRRAAVHPAGYAAVRRTHARALAAPSPWLTGLACATVAALVADEVRAVLSGTGRPRTAGAVVVAHLDELDIGVHPFLPDPGCPHCGGLPDDGAEAARLLPRSRPKPDPSVHRARPVDRERLLRTFVDGEVGLVRAVGSGTSAGLAVARAPVWLPPGAHEEAGWGRAEDTRTAEAVALLEALERYGGGRPLGRRTVVHAAPRDLGADAVDPRTLGLYPPHRQDEPGHRYPPYDDAVPRRWVWGHSFGRDRPVLVPEGYAYYRTRGLYRDDPPLAYEPSNGCAIGSCIEEAVLYGLLEVLERDAFLLTWHARMSVPRIDLDAVADPRGRLLAGEIERDTGYAVHVLDTTLEHGIPCVMALAVDRAAGPDRPVLAFAAGAHLDPAVAVRSALAELGPILAHQLRSYAARAADAAEMVADPFRVVAMEDHATLHGHRAALQRADFLLDPDPRCLGGRPVASPVPGPDLRDDLMAAVGRMLDVGLDVVVVDQTAAEHRAADLRCVKVIVPGTLPMTFGHVNRRLDGLPRLLTVPRLLGRRDRDLRRDEVSELPHPFP
jgi:ribosomal protein S12 methylthiotransferase accessory factor